MAFTSVTLTAGSGYRTATGATPPVRIRAKPLAEMTNGTIVVKDEVVIPLSSGGTATKTIYATTDPGTTSSGTKAYRFYVETPFGVERTFTAAVPHDAGSTVSIASLVELDPPPDPPPSGFALADATDVAGTAPADGQVLTYDTGTGQWGPENATGGTGGYTDEQVRDVIGTALVAGSNITITPNDVADTITIAASGSVSVNPTTGKNALTGMYHADAYSGIDKTGATDSTTGINNLFAAVPSGATILFTGTYKINGPVNQPPDGVTVAGIGYATVWNYTPAAAGTMMTITNGQRVEFQNMQFTLPATTAGAGSTLFKISNSFAGSFTRCLFAGQHATAGDAYGVAGSHRGVYLTDNSGDWHFYNCHWNNLGTGVQTDCIQNSIVGGRFSLCYVGVYGAGSAGQPGMSITGYVDFVSFDDEPGVVRANIWCPVTGNNWWISDVWTEGADTSIEFGDGAGTGPAIVSMQRCHIAANTTCVKILGGQGANLTDIYFGESTGDGLTQATSLVVDDTYAVNGFARNLRSVIDGDPAKDTGSLGDLVAATFPSGWTYDRAGAAGGGGGSGGYATVQDEGTARTQRATLNFTGGGVTATDNSGSTRTDVTIPGITVQDEGSALTQRSVINFTGAGVTATDNAVSGRTDVTISTGGGGGYATVAEEGTSLTARTTLNFIGRPITAADNAGSTRTDVTVQDTPAVHAVGNSGTTLTIDVSSTSGPVKTITLTGNCTFTLTAPASGRLWTLDLFLTQDATGGRTVTWPAAVKWAGGAGAPTLSTAAGAKDWITLSTPDAGTTWYAAVVGKAWA